MTNTSAISPLVVAERIESAREIIDAIFREATGNKAIVRPLDRLDKALKTLKADLGYPSAGLTGGQAKPMFAPVRGPREGAPDDCDCWQVHENVGGLDGCQCRCHV